MDKLRVYIASPYTNGWMPDNVRRQIEAKHILMDHGFMPFAPLENHYSEIFKHRPEHEWFEWDLAWLKVSDILVRIKAFDDEGNEIPSPGADEECRNAKEWGIPVFVFDTLKDLESWAKNPDSKSQFYELTRE